MPVNCVCYPCHRGRVGVFASVKRISAALTTTRPGTSKVHAYVQLVTSMLVCIIGKHCSQFAYIYTSRLPTRMINLETHHIIYY